MINVCVKMDTMLEISLKIVENVLKYVRLVITKVNVLLVVIMVKGLNVNVKQVLII